MSNCRNLLHPGGGGGVWGRGCRGVGAPPPPVGMKVNNTGLLLMRPQEKDTAGLRCLDLRRARGT